MHSTICAGENGVSCFGHGYGKAAVSFINWNAVLGNDGDAFLSRSGEFVPVRLFACAAYVCKYETYMHQAWSMLATWKVV